MVNRVLIRIKVVQMLYSYLLTRSEFKINEAPEGASRDKRFSYLAYIDLLLLLIELSGISMKGGKKLSQLLVDKKLGANRVGKALESNPILRTAYLRGNTHIEDFKPLLQKLHDQITSTAVFQDYSKKRSRTLDDDVKFWTVILETVIAKSPDIIDTMRLCPEFTNQGFELGVADVCQTLRSYIDSQTLYNKAKADLVVSLDKAYELYLSIFALIIDLTAEQERRIENAKSKHLATSADLNPNTKLIDNKLASFLADNVQLQDLMKEYKVERNTMSTPLLRSLLDKILESDLYAQYAASPRHSMKDDVEFWKEALRTIILPSDDLAEYLEDKSVYWNDDLQIMGTFALKTLRQIATTTDGFEFLPKFKDEEDENFGPELFMLAVKNQELYRSYIDRFIERSNWDPERLAYMDIVILTTAIAEIINYPKIPIPVSVNEYVDIANGYSTEKSGGFINGILDSVINYLRQEGILIKQ